jgi:Ca2+-binding EF-hand superfamily protein
MSILTYASVPMTTAVPEKDEEPFESLLNRFRKFFPSPERNSLTAEFKKLTQAVGVGDKKASSMSLGYNEFKFALASVKPEMQATFKERAIFRLFQYMDISAAHRVTLFEFVRQMRGEMPPYRRALVEYVFLYIDSKNDGVIDEQEVIFFYENSELPEIVNGTVPVAVKVQTFFKAIMGQSNKKSVKFDQLVDFYLTRSLRIESDLVFKQGILTEWNFTVEEVDGYVKQKYPNLVSSAGHSNPSGAATPQAAKSNTPKGSVAAPSSPAKPPASDVKSIPSTSAHGTQHQPQNQSQQQQPQLKSILKSGNKSRVVASGSNNSLDELAASAGRFSFLRWFRVISDSH